MKIYLIKYYGGSHDDYYAVNIFATKNKDAAMRYIEKFNNMLKKWKEYYSQFESGEFGHEWIKNEFVHTNIYDRWYKLKNISGCDYDEIELF